jgi:hypothetical protein
VLLVEEEVTREEEIKPQHDKENGLFILLRRMGN